MRKFILASIMLVLSLGYAEARTHHRHHHPFRVSTSRHHHHYAHHHRHHGVKYATGEHTSSGRPHAWCGWYMRQVMHVADAALNLARNWAHWGRETTPHDGAIVVWPHHVGRIVGGSPGHWIIESGNDGNAVRRRERSISGAIAFREG